MENRNMIDAALHADLLRKTLSRGGEFADIYAESRHSTSLIVEDGRLEKIIAGTDSGAGIRLVCNGRTSYGYSNELAADVLLRSAGEVSRLAASRQEFPVCLEQRRSSVDYVIRTEPAAVPLSVKVGIVRNAERAARAFDPHIRQVTVIYRDAVQHVEIASSDGHLCTDDRRYVTFIVQVVAARDGQVQTGYEAIGGFTGLELLDTQPAEQVALNAAARAVKMLSARKAPAGRMPVVISSLAGGTMIHEAIGHGLEADLAHQGLSVFSGAIGTVIASPLVTVIDDATLPGKRGSFRFDDEGTPAGKTVLVEKGVLRSYLHDRLSGMRSGSSSTGNGRRESFRNRPIPRMTNTFILQGDADPEQIVRSVDAGLLVVKMGGGQVNTVTGDFVFDVQEGYLIRDGRKGDMVRGATLTGNGPRILKSIDMVGRDLGFSIGTCGKDSQGVPVTDAMPTVRIPEMVVGGSYS